jgi:hypothetical protein
MTRRSSRQLWTLDAQSSPPEIDPTSGHSSASACAERFVMLPAEAIDLLLVLTTPIYQPTTQVP